MFQWPNFTRSSKLIRFSCTIKTIKCFLMKLTHDDTIIAQEVYSQLSFERSGKIKISLFNYQLHSLNACLILSWQQLMMALSLSGDFYIQ